MHLLALAIHVSLKGVVKGVDARTVIHGVRLRLHAPHKASLHLFLLHCFNKSRLVHVNAMLHLQFLGITDQKAFVPRQLISHWLNRNFINRHVNLHGVHGHEELLSDVENVPREEGPVTLRLN